MNELITNGTEIKQRIISEINKAEYSVKIAMAYFTDRDIARAIVEAKNNGVDVDVILSSNSQNETVKSILEDAGVCIDVFDTGDTRGIMHHKFSLIDNKISINGSYNYSFNASTNNVENVQISDDLSTYNQFNSEFEGLKIKIKNNMNTTGNIILKETEIKPKQPINIIESFSKQLNDLVYSSTKINNSEYNSRGYEDSKKNNGDINIFRTEYSNIKHEIIKYATDESLGNIKSKLSADISLSYQSTKTNLEIEKEEKIVETPFGMLLFDEADAIFGKRAEVIYVDADTLEYPLTLRKWEDGDFFYPLGMSGKKKISKYLKDEKLSLLDKEQVWVLCANNIIVWVVNRRADNRFKVTESTENILKITLQ